MIYLPKHKKKKYTSITLIDNKLLPVIGYQWDGGRKQHLEI